MVVKYWGGVGVAGCVRASVCVYGWWLQGVGVGLCLYVVGGMWVSVSVGVYLCVWGGSGCGYEWGCISECVLGV